MKYVKKQWTRQIRVEGLHIQHSKVHQCDCGVKFIEIKDEIDKGYKRTKCPYCDPYIKFHKAVIFFKVFNDNYDDYSDNLINNS